MNKAALIKAIVAQLSGGLDLYFKAARDAHAEATHEQSKAENKYDTRGLEASYLARGQSRQAKETELAIKAFENLAARSFGPGDSIEVGAIVEMDAGKERNWYFIGPKAGGTEVAFDDKTIAVLTPQSPLGLQLMGKKQGDRLRIELGAAREEYKIRSVI